MVNVKEDMTGWKMWEHGVPDSKWIIVKQMEDQIRPSGKHVAMWLCECSCEQHTQKIVSGSSVRNGTSLSCGCVRKERSKEACFIDMTGWIMNEHGVSDSRLTVIELIGINKHREAQWLCECSCEEHNKIIVIGSSIRSGHTLSCGCLNKERVVESLKSCVINCKTHGESNTRLFHIWQGMHKRCKNPNASNYYLYGARGIKVCEEWDNYVAFANWAKDNGYNDDLTIERNNVDGNYCPENCKWATRKEQANNTRANHYITYNGQTHTISEWADILHINYGTLCSRINRGWSVDEALNTPINQ